MQTIYLDISNKGVVPTIYAKQGDVGRKFEVVLTDSGLPYIPVGGSVFSVWYDGDSGQGNYTDIGDKSAFTVNGNKVTVELITQMLAVAGEGLLCLVLNGADGSQIASWNIKYVVESIPGATSEQANAYYTAFSSAVENLPYPDESLSVQGKAADAAATGAALAGKAPAGYGLGMTSCESITSLAALDETDKNGKYYLKLSGSELIDSAYQYGNVEVTGHDNWDVTQTLIATGNTTKLSRRGRQGSWQPWEYVNPPMVPGVEYRTTERRNGKVVYTMAINGGALTNGGYVTFTNANRQGGIRCCASAGGYIAPFYSGGTLVFAASAEPASDGVRVSFYSNGWLDSNNVTVTLWYTKE
jgi:hypothetical protein